MASAGDLVNYRGVLTVEAVLQDDQQAIGPAGEVLVETGSMGITPGRLERPRRCTQDYPAARPYAALLTDPSLFAGRPCRLSGTGDAVPAAGEPGHGRPGARAPRRPDPRVATPGLTCRARSLRDARRQRPGPGEGAPRTAGRTFATVNCRWPACCRPGGADEPDQQFIRAHQTDHRPGRDHRPGGTVRLALCHVRREGSGDSQPEQPAGEGGYPHLCRAAYSTTIELG
jgi:hypothetical protein